MHYSGGQETRPLSLVSALNNKTEFIKQKLFSQKIFSQYFLTRVIFSGVRIKLVTAQVLCRTSYRVLEYSTYVGTRK